MNSLRIVVRRTGAELTVFRRRRVFVRTPLDPACADLPSLLRRYKPAFVTAILDAGHAESQFLPVDRLSWRDRYRLKCRAGRTPSSNGTLILPPVFRTVGTPGRKVLAVTACELSPLSRNILDALIGEKIPLKAVDLRQRVISSDILKQHPLKTKWACVLSEEDAGGTTLCVWGQGHMMMVRSLAPTADLGKEIVQTFQYLEREAYVPEEGITLFLENVMPQIDPRPLGESLGGPVVLGDAFATPERFPYVRHLPQPATASLHRSYLFPRSVMWGAQTVTTMAVLTLPFYAVGLYREKVRTEALLAQQSQPSLQAFQAAFQEHTIRSEKRKKWTDLWVFNANQPAVRRGTFFLSATLLATLQKTQVVHSFECEVPEGSEAKEGNQEARLSFQIVASPISLHQNFTVPAQEIEATLQRAYFEASTQAQQIVLRQLHRTIIPRGALDPADKTMTLALDLGNEDHLMPLTPPAQTVLTVQESTPQVFARGNEGR